MAAVWHLSPNKIPRCVNCAAVVLGRDCARMPQSLNLTPNQRQRFTRLEKISELLRYSAPVWLWQLCDSKWSQANA
jgi:hypothetical protein